jgi:Ricin-type beta-trefoil lectin domain-like
VSWNCPQPIAQGNCTSWPPEIDVMEQVNYSNNNGFTDWWNVYPNQQSAHSSCQGPSGCAPPQQISSSFGNGFHVFRVEWGVSGQIVYSVDGYVSASHNDNTPGPMRIAINTAIGGGLPGGANGSGWPVYQYVDYVRVYQQGGINTGAHYKLVNRNSGKLLDDALPTGPGTVTHQWDGIDATQQRWQFNSAGGGWYQLQNVHDGAYCLNQQGSTSDGGLINTWNCVSSSNLNWGFSDQGNGWNHVYSQTDSNECLDNSGSWSNGQQLKQWTCQGGNQNQMWEVIQVP